MSIDKSDKNINQRMITGVAWSVLSRLIVRGIGFVSTLILARLLIPEDFGLVVLAMTCVGILQVMGEFGLDTVLIAHKEEDPKLYNTAWTIQILRGVIVAAFLFFFSSWLAGILGDDRLTIIIKWLALGALFQGLQNIGVVEFRKHLQLQKELVFQVIQKICSFIITLTLAFYLQNYWALVAGIVVGHFSGLILSFILSNYRPRLDLSRWDTVFNFSKWLVFINLLNYASAKGDAIILGAKMGTEQLGYYSVANEISSLPTSELVFPLQRAIFPGFSKLSDNIKTLRESYLAVFTLVCMIATPLGIGIGLVAAPMISLLLGEKWLPAVPYVEILAVSGAIRVAGASAGSVLYALQKVKLVSVIGIFNTLIKLGLLFWFIDIYGSIGAAWAVLISTFVSLLIYLTVLSNLLEFSLIKEGGSLVRTFFSLAAMYFSVGAVEMLFVHHGIGISNVLMLVSQVSVGGLSYCFTLWVMWVALGKPVGPEKLVESFIVSKLSKRNAQIGDSFE